LHASAPVAQHMMITPVAAEPASGSMSKKPAAPKQPIDCMSLRTNVALRPLCIIVCAACPAMFAVTKTRQGRRRRQQSCIGERHAISKFERDSNLDAVRVARVVRVISNFDIGVTLANAGLLSAAPSLASFVTANIAGHVGTHDDAQWGEAQRLCASSCNRSAVFGAAGFLCSCCRSRARRRRA